METAGSGLLAQLAAKSGLGVLSTLGACGLARRFRRLRAKGERPGALRIVESAALAPNRALHIVAVGRRAFLLASSPSQITMLGEVTSELPSDEAEALPCPAPFASVLARLVSPEAICDRRSGWLDAAASALRREAGGGERA
jgi:flagellar biogenesis protein FliO